MGGSGSSSGKGGSSGGANPKSQATIDRKIDRTGFKAVGGGVYRFDTPYGGGQIEGTDMPFIGTIYQAHAWNANYSIIKNVGTDTKDTRQFSTLNAAKSWIKNAVKKAAK